MPALHAGEWVLVADSEKALFLENVGDAVNPKLAVRRKESQDNPPAREQAANRPGRFQDGPSPHRSAVDDTDWHELAKERFADDLAELLYAQAHRGAFERLTLIASPSVLGDLRGRLHETVRNRVVGEIDKTLTNLPVPEIQAHVRKAVEA